MAISLLGPLLVDGQEALPPRDRVVLAALAVHPGEVVPAERLADALWGDSPPKSWPKIVQGCVMRLRRVLGDSAVATTTGGYRLTLDEGDIDAHRFERLIAKARSAAAAGEQQRAALLYRQALQLWRGPPLTDLEDWPAGRAEAARLRELRDSAREALTEAEIRSSHDGVAMASALVADDPLRERRWWLLALALYRAGRQNDALSTIRRGVRTLREELGLDPGPELAALEAAILRGDPELAGPPAPTPVAGTRPYQGLVPYGSAQAEWFFGRQDEIELCRRALRRSPLLLVTGPSGVGKSSLVRAGVVPALEEEGHTVAVFTPGADPPAALTAALSSPGRVSVVVVDQLEELLPDGRIARGGEAFLDRLAGLSATGTLVVATLRADQLGAVAEHSPAFARAVEQGLHLVPRMTPAELRQVIERPAQLAGARLQPGLVELLLREVADEPGALPLLSHALAETWERREADVLTVEGYQATGGIQGAVRTSAEGLYESLDARQQAAMRSILLRLVTTSPQGEAVAARVAKDAVVLGVEHAQVVDLLARARLVTVDEGGVAIAHEALTRAWPRLRAWLDEDQRGQRILRHVSLAAADWHQRGRPDSELYRGARLEDALAWRAGEQPALSGIESAFLDSSAARADDERAAAARHLRQQTRQNRRLRLALAGVGCGLVAALAAGGLAVQRSREATAAARTAHVGQLVADSIALRSTDRDVAALLAVEAHRLQPGPATRGALLGLFTDAPGFLGYLPAGPAPLASARMSNDGRSLVGVGADGAVRLVNPQDGGVRRTLPAPELRSQSAVVALAADRDWAAVVNWRGSDLRGGLAALNVVDLADGRQRMAEARLPLDPGAVAMSADGRYVAVAGGAEGRVLVVEPAVLRVPGRTDVAVNGDVPGARWVRPLPTATRTDDVRHSAAVAFDRRGRLLVGSPSGVVRIVEPATGAVVSTWTGAPPGTSDRALVASAEGGIAVSAGDAGVVRWNPRTGRPQWTAPLDEGRCRSVVIAQTASSVICGGESGEVVGLDLGTGRPTGARFDLQRGSVGDLLLSRDGTTLLEVSRTLPVLARWRIDGTGPITRRLPVEGVPEGYSSDGRLLTVGGRPPVVVDVVGGRHPHSVVVDARSGAVVDPLDDLTSPVWTGHPSVLVAWQGSVGKVVDVEQHRVVGALEGGVGSIPHAQYIHQRGDHLLVWDYDNGEDPVPNWLAWTLPDGRITRGGDRDEFTTASLSADGREVFVSGESGLKAIDLGTGARRTGPEDVVFAAASPSGVLVGATNSGQVNFYDPGTFTADGRSLRGPAGGVDQLAFSSDGRTMAVRGTSGALHLVDVAARVQLGGPFPVVERHQPVALRPDGQELAVPGADGVLLWNLDAAALVQAACTYAGRNLTPAETRAHRLEARQTCPAR